MLLDQLSRLPADLAHYKPSSKAGALLNALGSSGTGQPPTPEVKIVLHRLVDCYHRSWLLFAQSAAYIASLEVLGLLGIEHLIGLFKADLEEWNAQGAGIYHTTAEGKQLAYSFVSLQSPAFKLPYPTLDQALPRVSQNPERPKTAHFAALAAQLAYEQAAIVEDVVRHRWGMAWHGHRHIPSHANGLGYAPDLVWWAASTPSALLLAFKGAEPMFQIDRRSDVPVRAAAFEGMGSVNVGFMRGLEQRDPASTPQGESKQGQRTSSEPERGERAVWETLLATIREHGRGKAVYLCGHSLGGAVCVVLAQLLAVRCPEVAAQLTAVHSFAAPRSGDAAFCRLLSRAFPGRVFRYQNSADMVCMLPAGAPYVNHGASRLITALPQGDTGSRLVREEVVGPAKFAAIERAEEDNAYRNGWLKLKLSEERGESLVRRMGRWGMLGFPGLCCHLPSDYESALRAELAL